MLKRILSIIIAFSMILPLTQINAFAEDEMPPQNESEIDAAYKDNTGTGGSSTPGSTVGDINVSDDERASVIPEKYSKIIKEFGIFDADEINAADKVSYSDFYKIYKRMSETEPSDFKNDNYVTFMYVIKEFADLANYGMYANTKGGYPYGYIAACNAMDMLDDVAFKSYDGFVDYASLCAMIYNTLTAPIYDETEFTVKDGENAEINYSKKGSMLEERFNTYYSDGILTGTEKSDIYGEKLGAGTIKIDGVRMNYAYEDVHNLIGHRVEYYYKKNSTVNTVIAIAESDNQDIKTVYSSEIDSFKDNTFEYTDENNKSKKIKIPNGTMVLKNGVFTGYTGTYDLSATLDVLRGKIDFIDNDDNGSVDIISITEYTVRIVDSANRTLKIIHCKDNLGKIALGDFYTDGGDYVCYSLKCGGDNVDFDFILPWDVILVSYAKGSSGKNYYDIEIIRHRISGTITSSNTKDEEIYIDNVKYGISPCLNLNKVKPGIYAEFVLSANNEVADIVEKKQYSYGFLMGAATKSGISDGGELKIMTETEESTVFTLADKVKIDGKTKKAADCVVMLTGKYMLIAYETNAAGEISRIYTAENVGKDESKFSLDADHTANDKSITGDARYNHYREDVFIYKNPFFNDLYSPSDECVIFYVKPSVIDDNKAPDEDDIFVGGATSISDTIDISSSYEKYVVRAKMYDTDDMYRAGAIVIYRDDIDGSRLTSNYNTIAIINSVSLSYVDGEEYYRVDYYKDGSTDVETAYAKPDELTKAADFTENIFKYYNDITSISQLKCGDVIQMSIDGKGFIKVFRPVFLADKAYDEGEYWGVSRFKFWNDLEMVYTKVKSIEDTSYIAKVYDHDRFIRFTKGDNVESFVYDRKRKTLTLYPDMTITNELAEGTEVFMIRSYSKMKMQMIIK